MSSQLTFADVFALGIIDIELAQYLYEREVITVYGSPWGPTNGPSHLRFSLANPVEYERECVEKLVESLTDYVKNNCRIAPKFVMVLNAILIFWFL